MSDGFKIDYSLLPPDLRLKLWVLALDADTSKVNIAYKRGVFRSSLSYKYGGAISASLGVRRFTGTIGVKPDKGDVNLGMVFHGIRFGANYSPKSTSGGVSVGYGAPLLPFPNELNDVFGAGGIAATRVVGSLPGAFNDPLAMYRLRSDDIATISKAVSTAQKIHKAGKKDAPRFGAGMSLHVGPMTGLTITGGAQFHF